jgi:hypothetical protein
MGISKASGHGWATVTAKRMVGMSRMRDRDNLPSQLQLEHVDRSSILNHHRSLRRLCPICCPVCVNLYTSLFFSSDSMIVLQGGVLIDSNYVRTSV